MTNGQSAWPNEHIDLDAATRWVASAGRHVVGRGWIQRRRIMFAGESSPGVYSIIVEWSQNHNSAAGNLYFHQGQREFRVFDGRVAILDVTRDELRFRFEHTGSGR